MSTFTIRIHDDEPHGFWASVDELPGCFATGDTLNELNSAIGEAIVFCLEDVPEAVQLTFDAAGDEWDTRVRNQEPIHAKLRA